MAEAKKHYCNSSLGIQVCQVCSQIVCRECGIEKQGRLVHIECEGGQWKPSVRTGWGTSNSGLGELP